MRSEAIPAFHWADAGAAVPTRSSVAQRASAIQRIVRDRIAGIGGSLRAVRTVIKTAARNRRQRATRCFNPGSPLN
jgi:hypothetical protein